MPALYIRLFLKAIELYGVPSRIRCDQGRDNIEVARHMLRYHGDQRRLYLLEVLSIIRGWNVFGGIRIIVSLLFLLIVLLLGRK